MVHKYGDHIMQIFLRFLTISMPKIVPTICLMLLTSLFLPSVSWSVTVYSVGSEHSIISNATRFSQATLTTPEDFIIGGVKLTTILSSGTTKPLIAGYVWLKLTRSVSGEADTTIMLFNLPATYPGNPLDPNCSVGGSFDSTCITTELNGSYMFADSAAADFDSSTIAAIGETLTPGAYHSSIASLDVLIGLQGNATYRITTASLWSGTNGYVDWQLELTAVPEPASIWLSGAALISMMGCTSSKYFGQGPLFAKRQF